MTTPADDAAVEEAFEAYLAGRSVPGAEPRLVSFADAVRASATEPGRPSAALAELLATGLLTDRPGPASQPVRAPRRRRRRMLATALFAKIASAGLVAKAASVAGVAVVGLTTAGFTGNLGPAQHSFATLVDHATPFTAPDTTPAPADVGVPPADDEIGSTPPVTSPTPSDTADPSTAETGTAQQGSDESGEESPQVTPPAHPSNHGGQVSDWAHQKNEDRKSGASTVPAKPSKSSSGRISGEHSEHGSSHGSDD